MLQTIALQELDSVVGGCLCGRAFNTGITGGMANVPNNTVPRPTQPATQGPGNFNTGITGGMAGVPNNQVPLSTQGPMIHPMRPPLRPY